LQSRFIDDLPALIDAKIATEKAYGYFNTLWHIARSKFNAAILSRILRDLGGEFHRQRLYVLKKAIARRKRHKFVKAIKQFRLRLLRRRRQDGEKDDTPEPSP